MTPQEEQLLNSLVERVNQTQLQEKDPDAEALLEQGLGPNPDALYVMAQTVLVQNIALEQAKAQVTQLQQQAQQARQQPHATSFLGNLLGHHDPAPPPTSVAQPAYVPPPPPPPGYDPQYQQPQYQQPQYIPAGQPSFLQGAMQTAAGVAAGALAFEGVEAVLHGLGGFGHPGYGFGGPGIGMGGFGMGSGFERPVEETVVNNYYDQPGGQEHHIHESAGQSSGQFSDQGGTQLSDANYVQTADNQGSFDNSNLDDSVLDGNLTQDDGGSGFDDGGSFDSSGGDDGGGGGF